MRFARAFRAWPVDWPLPLAPENARCSGPRRLRLSHGDRRPWHGTLGWLGLCRCGLRGRVTAGSAELRERASRPSAAPARRAPARQCVVGRRPESDSGPPLTSWSWRWCPSLSLSDRFRTANGWPVESVRLSMTPDHRGDEWLRVRRFGFWIADVSLC